MKIPKKLQSVFWSADINKLDLEKDKNYIIHQIFSHGNLDDIKWVFDTFSRNEISNIFISTPYKDYRKSRFYFIKNHIINLKDKLINENRYVKNTPRDIR